MQPDDSVVASYVERIRNGDSATREAAMDDAAKLPATAVGPLAELATVGDKAVARAAQESLRRLVYACADTGGARKVSAELVKLVGQETPHGVRSAALNLLGCCGGAESVRAIAAQLLDPHVREDARTALERIPSPAATAALRAALKTTPAEFQPAIQQSLRRRSRKLRDAGIS